jgi:ubiquinone/menaquinone biosynthesis C-methylase UbiE
MGVTGSTVTNFDAWAGHYDHSPLQPSLYLPVHQSTLRLAGRLVPHPRRILDVGCGTARLLRQARRQYPGAELVGVDPAWQMVAIARSGTSPGLQIGYVQGAVERLPFVCEGFDLVVATLSFRHWTDPKAGIGQLARVLAPGGLLVLADVFSSCRHRVGGIRLRWRRRLPVPAQLAPVLVAYELTVIAHDHTRWFALPDVLVIAAQKPAWQDRGTGPLAAAKPEATRETTILTSPTSDR